MILKNLPAAKVGQLIRKAQHKCVKRNRIPPTQYWLRERPVYRRNAQGCKSFMFPVVLSDQKWQKFSAATFTNVTKAYCLVCKSLQPFVRCPRSRSKVISFTSNDIFISLVISNDKLRHNFAYLLFQADNIGGDIPFIFRYSLSSPGCQYRCFHCSRLMSSIFTFAFPFFFLTSVIFLIIKDVVYHYKNWERFRRSFLWAIFYWERNQQKSVIHINRLVRFSNFFFWAC